MFGSWNQCCCVSVNMRVCWIHMLMSVGAGGKGQITILMNPLLRLTALSIVAKNQFCPITPHRCHWLWTNFSWTGQLTHTHTHKQKKTTVFPWRYLVGGERVEASVCSPVLPSAVSTLLSIITSSFLSCHPPFIAFISHLFFKNKNISNIGKLYYKEGVAWMYVYMRNYVKIKKMINQRKNKQKKCKDN